MKMKRFADLGVRAALWMIHKQSPFCRIVTPRETMDGNDIVRPEWNPPEAAVAWAIYERAVLDAHGFTSGHKLDEESMHDARYTAETGCIILDGVGSYDLLSALGIDNEWACNVINDITARYEGMFAYGWTP